MSVKIKKSNTMLVVLLLVALMMIGCGIIDSAADPLDDSAESIDVPDTVTDVRDSALDFLRDSAYAVIPPTEATWMVEGGRDDLPTGYDYYFYSSDTAIMSVSYPIPAGDLTQYHVTYGDVTTGLCWQANLDAEGHLLNTGFEAELGDGPDNPAAIYCTEQGYTYEIIDEPAGGQCGVCVFDDNSICNGWAYLRGQCGPGDRPRD